MATFIRPVSVWPTMKQEQWWRESDWHLFTQPDLYRDTDMKQIKDTNELNLFMKTNNISIINWDWGVKVDDIHKVAAALLTVVSWGNETSRCPKGHSCQENPDGDGTGPWIGPKTHNWHHGDGPCGSRLSLDKRWWRLPHRLIKTSLQSVKAQSQYS